MGIFGHFVVFLWLMTFLTSAESRGPSACNYKGQRYAHLAKINHDNGCAILQCQFGQVVTYYEACGTEIDGNCHRLNLMFEYQGHTYKCRKVPVGTKFEYRNEIAVPRIENCAVEGKTYQTLQKFRLSGSCTEHQCQNGVIFPLDAECNNEIDGRCHLVGENFVKGGVTYNCTNREENGVNIYENTVLDPQQTRSRSCTAGGSTFKHLEVFTLPGSCVQRQCRDNRIKILTLACMFKQDQGKCYSVGEEWSFQNKTYLCNFDQANDTVRIEIKHKGYGMCKRYEKWYDHLEIHTRPDGCTSVQCQDGITPPVQEGCLWNVDDKCYDLNLIWKNNGATLKCILTGDGLYRIVHIDENGNIIDKEPPPTETPDFGDICETIAADIIFVWDSSGSITRANYERLLNFSCEIVSAVKIGHNNVQIGAVIFSGTAEKVFDLKTYDSYDSICKAIRATPFLGDITETHRAFNLIVDEEMFGTESGGRPGVIDIVIVVTDGNSTNTSNTLAAADRLKARGVQMISIGVGRIAHEELYGIASRPENVFNTSGYEAIYSLKEQLSNRTCTVPKEPPVEPEEPETVLCPDTVADIVFLLDSSSGAGTENYNLKLDLAVNLTGELTISPKNVQIAAVLISSEMKTLFNLNTYASRKDVHRALKDAPYLGGDRETDDALSLLDNGLLFSSARGGRDNAARIVVVIIDGPSTDLNRTLTLAKRVRNQGVRIITVGIGKYDQKELIGLSGYENNVFGATSYPMLNFVKSSLYDRICQATKEPRPGTEPPRCSDTVLPPCDHICENINVGYICSCNRVYVVSPRDKTKCEDKNECKERPPICQQRCVNTEGSYECTCKDGYVVSQADPSRCTDINECLTFPCQHYCNNTDGSYRCSCKKGYQVITTDSNKCEDINECLTSPCQHYCNNTDGSYRCSCKDGYKVNTTHSNKCQDINECLTSPCQHYCNNTDGSYSCSCKDGYQVNTTYSNKCEDIDECLDTETPPCHQKCTNTDGSYACSCKDGYTPNICDPNSCKDIDECEHSPCEQTCTNTRGSFRCSCFPGFVSRADDFTKCEALI